MKGKVGRVLADEGWIVLAVLLAFVFTGLMLKHYRQPREITVEPVSCVSAEASATAVPFAAAEPELLNINTATVKELMTLPGIGEVLAERIAAYREEHGPFSSVEELNEVNGIGKAKLAALRGLVFAG